MALGAEDFRAELQRLFRQAEREGRPYLDVNSGELHRRLGDYPGPNHRMPLCCAVLRDAIRVEDQVLESPPSGQGASLTVRYRLPRG